ncbi:MAG: F420-0:Gamma-glutamyl ligase [Candidatus Zixiibacteriota bacterium]|jgi:hypothetical protein
MADIKKIPVHTHVVGYGDNIVEVVDEYTGPVRRAGDVILVTSKIVSLCQGRTVPFDDLRLGIWARVLWRFVSKPVYGFGAVGIPEKMQAAINLVGLPKILWAAACSAVTKLFGKRGVFFEITGHGVAEIDGTRKQSFDPLIRLIVYGPAEGNAAAEAIKRRTGCETAIIDAGDYGDCDCLGHSSGVDPKWVEDGCTDNPLGQQLEQTPVGLLREAV